MKRFIKVFANNSRDVVVVVKQDTEARAYRVLQWDAEDLHPKEIKYFRYVPRDMATSADSLMHHAQEVAIQFAARRFYELRNAAKVRVR